MHIFDSSNNTQTTIFDFDIDRKIEDTTDIDFDKINSTLTINDSLIVNLNSNSIIISDFYKDHFNLNSNNVLIIDLFSFEIDLNPSVIISNLKLTLTFKIIEFPVFINIAYRDNGSIVIYNCNTEGL